MSHSQQPSSLPTVHLTRRSFVAGVTALGAFAAAGALVGCGNADAASPAPQTTSSQADATVSADGAPTSASQATSARADATPSAPADAAAFTPMSDVAVVFFSVPLTESESRDADSGASIVMSGDEVFGNVQYVAGYVAAATGGDLLRIETETPYPVNDSIFDYALAEQDDNARPAISLVAPDGTRVDSLDAYQTVLVGYPIWWYELPMPLYTFFEQFDLAGKRVASFVVHGGSGLSGTVQDIETLQPDSTVEQDGLSISRNNVVEAAEGDVASWVGGLGLASA